MKKNAQTPLVLKVEGFSGDLINPKESFPVRIKELDPCDAWHMALQNEAQYVWIHKAGFAPNGYGHNKAEALLAKVLASESFNTEHWIKVDLSFMARLAWVRQEHAKEDYSNLPF
jgi:hypothetical protein